MVPIGFPSLTMWVGVTHCILYCIYGAQIGGQEYASIRFWWDDTIYRCLRLLE